MKNFINKIFLCLILSINTLGYGYSQPQPTGVLVNVNATPTASISGYYHICPGGSATIPIYLTNGPVWSITISDGYTTWTVNGITTSPYMLVVSPNNIRTYTILNVSNNLNCSDAGTGAATVIIDPVNLYTLSSSTTTFCQGSSSQQLILDGSDINYKYQLLLNGSPLAGTIIYGTGNALHWPGQSSPGTYTVKATSLSIGCETVMNGNVTLSMSPLPAIAGTILGATTLCQGAISTFTTSTVVNASSYIWSVPNGATIINGQGTPQISVYFTGTATSGDVSVFGQNTCGDGQSSSLSVTVNVAPFVDITANPASICAGSTTVITANGTGSVFTWSNNASTKAITVNPNITTTYSVIATSTNGCTNSDNITITVHPLPVVTLNLVTDHACTSTDSVVLAGGSPIGGSYSYVYGNASIIYPSVLGIGGFTITYRYTDTYGCTASATDILTINPVPVIMFTNVTGQITTNTPAFDLMPLVNLPGGTFSGPGVSSGSIFNPSVAGAGTHMITYTYAHPITGCTASQIQYIPVTEGIIPPNGIEFNNMINNIVIFPNPANEYIILKNINVHAKLKISIQDITGRIVYSHQNSLDEEIVIDITHFIPGSYIIKFANTDGISISKKIMKIQ